MEIMTSKIKVELSNFDKFYKIFSVTVPKINFQEIEHTNVLFKDISDLFSSVDVTRVISAYRIGKKYKTYYLVDAEVEGIKDFFDKNEMNKFQEKYNINISFDEKPKTIVSDEDKMIAANLLLCSLSKNEKNKGMSNTDGKLFEYIKTKGNQVVTLKYSLDDNRLCADVVTFTAVNGFSKEATFSLNNDFMVKNVRAQQLFIMKGEGGKKNIINFFSGLNFDAFINSKMVKMHRIAKLFNERFKGVCSIEYITKEVKEYKFHSIADKKRPFFNKVIDILKHHTINIIDNVHNESMVSKIIHFFEKNDIKYCIESSFCPEKLNLNIIHNKKYYTERKIRDEYHHETGTVIQHVTFEDFYNESDDDKTFFLKIEVILSELLIKYEVENLKINIYKTDNKIIHNYIFGEVKKIEDLYYDIRLDINDEKMNFIFSQISKQASGGEHIYLIHKKSGNIYNIIENNGYPIVDVSDMENLFKLYRRDFDIRTNLVPLLNLVKSEKFNSEFDEIKKICENETINTLENLYLKIRNFITKFDDKQVRKKYYQALSVFNKEIIKISENRVFLKVLFRNKNSGYAKTFVNFKYWSENGNFNYYSAPCSSVAETITKGYPIRVVNCDLCSEEIQDYLSLLDTDNIRKNQNTVVPFPFKYLREFSIQNIILNKELFTK